jgi:hypothetical protein
LIAVSTDRLTSGFSRFSPFISVSGINGETVENGGA